MTGVLLAIFFLECGQHFKQYPRGNMHALGLLVSGVPRMLILMIIVGLAGTLVVETFRMSHVVALILTGILILVVVLCLLFSWSRNRGRL
jgi:hypothetical protein